MAESARRRSSWIAAYVAAFSALAFVYAVAALAAGAKGLETLSAALTAIVPNAVVGLASLAVARRFPWRAHGRAIFLAAHALALVIFTLAATGGWLGMIALDSWIERG